MLWKKMGGRQQRWRREGSLKFDFLQLVFYQVSVIVELEQEQ